MICPHCHKDTEVGQEKYSAEKDFDIFWSAYPRKVSKLAALKAWRKVALNSQVKDEIMRGLGEQRHVMVTGGIKYTPHAATWLNGRRWEDEQAVTPNVARYIACDKCGDSGIRRNSFGLGRCSCPRGQAPGLLIPQDEGIDPNAFQGG